MGNVLVGLMATGYVGALFYFLFRARMYGHSSIGIVLAFIFSPYAVAMGCYWLLKDLYDYYEPKK